MVKLKNQFKTIYLFLITFIGLLFIFNNNRVMAMGNKHSNNNEILNDEEYSLYIQAELAIQNELTNFKLDNEKNKNFYINIVALQKK